MAESKELSDASRHVDFLQLNSHDEDLYRSAAYSSDASLIKWLYRAGCPVDDDTFNEVLCCFFPLEELKDVCIRQLRSFSLGELVMFLHEKGCPWTAKTATCAYRRSKELLKLVRSLGCPMTVDVLNESAARGDLETMQWALDEVSPGKLLSDLIGSQI